MTTCRAGYSRCRRRTTPISSCIDTARVPRLRPPTLRSVMWDAGITKGTPSWLTTREPWVIRIRETCQWYQTSRYCRAMYARAAPRSRDPSSRRSVGSRPTLWSVWIERVPLTSPAYCCWAIAVRWSMRAAARLGLVAVGRVVAGRVAAVLARGAPEDASAAPQPAMTATVAAAAAVLPKRLKKHRMWLLEIGVFKLRSLSLTGAPIVARRGEP